MTLVQLKHLLALAGHGSFSRAAAAVFLTQPALSRSIRALEDELGQALFDRVGRRVELTPCGREVLQRAHEIVRDVEELEAAGERLRQGAVGSLRLGLVSGPSALVTVPLLRHVATHHPGLHVEVARGHAERLVQALRERQLDALVLDPGSLAPADDLRIEMLAEVPGAFMCRRGHPLLQQSAPIGFDDVRRYPLACTPLSDEVARMLIERYGPQAHPARCVSLRSEELPGLVEVVRDSDAVLLAIRAAAPDLMELHLTPPLDARARFAAVVLARRSESPAWALLRPLIQARLAG